MYGSHFTHGDFVRVSSIVIVYARDFSTIRRNTVRVSSCRACVTQCAEKGNYRRGSVGCRRA